MKNFTSLNILNGYLFGSFFCFKNTSKSKFHMIKDDAYYLSSNTCSTTNSIYSLILIRSHKNLV